jgi:hypothetical protein
MFGHSDGAGVRTCEGTEDSLGPVRGMIRWEPSGTMGHPPCHKLVILHLSDLEYPRCCPVLQASPLGSTRA